MSEIIVLFTISLKVSSPPPLYRSCLEHFKNGGKTSGQYTILDYNNDERTVYCDMESEPGSIWTLVMSFSRENKDQLPFLSTPMYGKSPKKARKPNWLVYRMGFLEMSKIKNNSTLWRITCSFPQYGVNISKDYVRAAFTDFDLMSNFWEECKKVSHISVMGQSCSECTAQWWQGASYAPHIAAVQVDPCDIKSDKSGYYYFGSYHNYNPAFRCTESPNSTTNYWFGSYV